MSIPDTWVAAKCTKLSEYSGNPLNLAFFGMYQVDNEAWRIAIDVDSPGTFVVCTVMDEMTGDPNVDKSFIVEISLMDILEHIHQYENTGGKA